MMVRRCVVIKDYGAHSWKQGKFSLEGYTPAKMAAGADAPKAHFPYSPTIFFVLLKCFLPLLFVCIMFYPIFATV